jgi:hypothetical protein
MFHTSNDRTYILKCIQKIIFRAKICHTKSVASEALKHSDNTVKKYEANFLLFPIIGKENKSIYINISVFNTDRI